jgi:SdrD B-like domain
VNNNSSPMKRVCGAAKAKRFQERSRARPFFLEVAAAATDGDGNCTFGAVLPGGYRVEFVAPAGSSFTLHNRGDDAFDSDVIAAGVSQLFWLVSGQFLDHLDAGII